MPHIEAYKSQTEREYESFRFCWAQSVCVSINWTSQKAGGCYDILCLAVTERGDRVSDF